MKLDDYDPNQVDIEDQRGVPYFEVFDLYPFDRDFWFPVEWGDTPYKFCSYHVDPAKTWCVTLKPGRDLTLKAVK